MTPLPFHIKICGITRVADALAAAELGAVAIGLNFYPRSKRFVEFATAERISATTPAHVSKVGVFVNALPEAILEIAERCGLDFVQLHGDEPPGFAAELPGLRVIRAFRTAGEVAPFCEFVMRDAQAGSALSAVLIDGLQAGEYGGTGVTVDWAAFARGREQLAGLPIILAGGLRPENVAEAIRTVRPDAVDTASGVEDSPGVKSPEKMRAFIEAARRAFAGIGC